MKDVSMNSLKTSELVDRYILEVTNLEKRYILNLNCLIWY